MNTSAPPFDLALAHRHFAADCFNKTWELMRKPQRTVADNRMMLALTHASVYHWSQRADCSPKNMCIGYWQISRVHALLGDASHARTYADICLSFSTGLEPFYCAYAYEALARAETMSGDKDGAATYLTTARELAAQVSDANDRAALEADLATIA